MYRKYEFRYKSFYTGTDRTSQFIRRFLHSILFGTVHKTERYKSKLLFFSGLINVDLLHGAF
jgi:hypothetical protein